MTEQHPQADSPVASTHAETGALMRVNTSSAAVRNEYAKQYRETVNYFEALWQKSGAGVVSCRDDESYTQKLLGYFKNRS